MAPISLFLGLISGTSFIIAAIIWYSSLFSNHQFSHSTVKDFNELKNERAYSLARSSDWNDLANGLPQKELLLLSSTTRGSEELINAKINLTKTLIQSHRINQIVIDSDWHQIYPINLYINGLGLQQLSAKEIINRSKLWPEWIISNQAFISFVDWLRNYNLKQNQKNKISIYGIGMNNPMRALDILGHDVQSSSQIAGTIFELKSCLNLDNQSFDSYAQSSALGGRTCQQEAMNVLTAIETSRFYIDDPENWQNQHLFELAKLIISAEQYYQYLHSSPKDSWNAQSLHQADTIERLMIRRADKQKMSIVWGHHSVLSNSLLPEVEETGYFTTRSVIEQKFNIHVIGLMAYEGEVLAASGIHQRPLPYSLLTPPSDSLESMLWVESSSPYFLSLLKSDLQQEQLAQLWDHRTISDVINNEGQKEFYSPITLAKQFDGVLFFPKVSPLRP
jgi:erythromycin esterase